ncbi:MAG: hypothetical protein WDO24_13795 [Pseudomonadota bacterium]
MLGSLLLGSASASAAPPSKPAEAKPVAPKPAVPKPAEFAAVLKQTLAGRKFTRAAGPDEAASNAMFERLVRGDYNLPALSHVADLAGLDRIVLEVCPSVKPPSQLVKDSTPFLLTGQFDAKTIPPGAAITVSDPAFAKIEIPSGRFLVYTVTLTGARVAPAPIIEARGISLADCRTSGDALSLVDGATTDATILGQGLAVIGGEPVWVVAARAERQAGVTLQPLDRRLKNYQVNDGWKFLSAP